METVPEILNLNPYLNPDEPVCLEILVMNPPPLLTQTHFCRPKAYTEPLIIRIGFGGVYKAIIL